MEDVFVKNSTGCEVVVVPKTSMFGLSFGGFESLVETLIIDLVILLIVLFLFTMLTKMSRNVDLSQQRKTNWIQLFYGDANITSNSSTDTDIVRTSKLENQEGYLFWFLAMLRLSDEDILHRSGLDSVYYLNFQKNIICLIGTMSVFNVLLVLPLNYVGEIEPTRKPFARTTMRNVDPKSNIAWVHPFVCYAYFLISLILLRKFSEVALRKKSTDVCNALLLKKLPVNQRYPAFIKEYFQSSYPGVVVEEVQFAYDVKKLVNLNRQRILVDSAIEWCEEKIAITGERPLMKAKFCGYTCDVCCKCCNAHLVDALTYYADRKSSLLAKIIKERDAAYLNPLSMAFVSFQTPEMANTVLQQKPERSTDEIEEYVRNWKLSYSPSSGNILWENLGVKRSNWYFMWLLSNCILLIIIIFFSTPNVVLNLSGVITLYEGLHISVRIQCIS